jgi:hypothetical protein
METLLIWLPVLAITAFTVWFLWRLALLIKADGYGFRSSSGLPNDWSPPELPSTPYVAKPHF